MADPYRVFLSEIMLQQTQAGARTTAKYEAFLSRFPTVHTLGKARLSDVYRLWQGLGYNRRAKFLRDAGRMINHEFGGVVPCTMEGLRVLPGVGSYTAAAVYVFSFNKAALLLETNIRAVFLHHFFTYKTEISDKEILPLIRATLDYKKPREWFYALMDYGSYLKKKYKNPSRRSSHHVKQTIFAGSDRELRGKLLKLLLAQPRKTLRELCKKLDEDPERVRHQLQTLVKEKFIFQDKARFKLL